MSETAQPDLIESSDVVENPEGAEGSSETFQFKILGRTLEHLGVQMYKQRPAAVAELVANSWDAGAEKVWIKVPDSSDYDPDDDAIIIRDDGEGMTPQQIQDGYLVVGRNRRRDQVEAEVPDRPVMGRKGIGKLAGFGIAERMQIKTLRNSVLTEFTLNSPDLKANDDEVDKVDIPAEIDRETDDFPGADTTGDEVSNGTCITLQNLRHTTAIDPDTLRTSLGRRFSRTVHGRMEIFVNGEKVTPPEVDSAYSVPPEDEEQAFEEEELGDGHTVKYRYQVCEDKITSKELQGFSVNVRGKTAEAPPFYFNVEDTASHQHGTKYFTGEIVADFLDEGDDDESDIISTDRQAIDWDAEVAQNLKEWGEELARNILHEWFEYTTEETTNWLLQQEDISARLEALPRPSREQVERFLRTVSKTEPDDREKALQLADSLVQAYEYSEFHDMIDEIEEVGEEPEQLGILLEHLSQWQVLESRAIKEIVEGRLAVVNRFYQMIQADVPETGNQRPKKENMRALLAKYPWLLNPEWQILEAEESLNTALRRMMDEDGLDVEEGGNDRFDFLGLSDDRRLVVIEIKRQGHAVEYDEIQRLDGYAETLARGSNKDIHTILIHGGTLNISSRKMESLKQDPTFNEMTWDQVHDRVRQHYEHFRDVLESRVDRGGFAEKEREVREARSVMNDAERVVLESDREEDLGVQDVDYTLEETSEESAD